MHITILQILLTFAVTLNKCIRQTTHPKKIPFPTAILCWLRLLTLCNGTQHCKNGSINCYANHMQRQNVFGFFISCDTTKPLF